jgi:hypothetical protein
MSLRSGDGRFDGLMTISGRTKLIAHLGYPTESFEAPDELRAVAQINY